MRSAGDMGRDSRNPFGTRSIDNSMFSGASPQSGTDISRSCRLESEPFSCSTQLQSSTVTTLPRDLPPYENVKKQHCYSLIPPKIGHPLSDCLARILSDRRESHATSRGERDGTVVHYRKKAMPLAGAQRRGSVMIVKEDVTERVISERELRRRADELEAAINRRNEEQQEKERKLTVLVNTVYGIKGAHDMRESIDKIICGFKELGARTTAFALFEDEDMYIFKIHPPDILQKLNGIFRIAIPGIHLRPRKNPGNPFVQTALIGKPTFTG